MKLELTPREIEVLDALLDAAHRARLHELHHTDSRDYRDRLRREIATLEALRAKLGADLPVS